VTLTEDGSRAEIYTESNIKIEYDKLVLLACAGIMQNGGDVALPNEFAACAEFLAESYGRRIYRYFRSSNDSGDSKARELACGQHFLRDGAVLALDVLQYLSENKLSIENAAKSIPDFACERREVQINCPPQRIITQLCFSGMKGANAASGNGEGVLFRSIADENHARESILVRSGKKGDSLVLFAQSLSSETAEELCNQTEKIINKLNNIMEEKKP
jgi:hypothetical protein